MLDCLVRAVKMFLSSRLIMNSRQLWNLHQRHKFLRAEASRDILKIRVSEMASPGVFKRYFPPRMPCCFIRIHARPILGTKLSQAFQYIARFEHFTDLNLFMCHSKLGNGCFTILFDGAYFLLAVSLEGDESSQLRMAN